MSRGTVEFIQRGVAFAHRALKDACNGTDEQLHFIPPDGSHSIAWCLWHTARIEDAIINQRARGIAPVWNEEWARRTGLGVLADNHHGTVALGPDGAAYVPVLGGFVRVADRS